MSDMLPRMRPSAWSILTLSLAAAWAQTPPPPLQSPEVKPDRTVTFRLRAPNAKEVFLSREGAPRAAMQKDEQGVWTLTTPPLEPDLYGYSFVVDGVSLMDPNNSLMKPNLLNQTSMVHIPGPEHTWEVNNVPHGTVNHHFYRSNLIGDQRDFYVYTPPNYASSGSRTYPVLYLLHGFSDDASGWTSVGRAHVILDNLIAEGKAQPMIVVMPLGYGAPEIVQRGAAPRTPALWTKNVEGFRAALLAEVMPQIDNLYRVKRDRESRAIAGLSMGGAESLVTGLTTLDRFAYVGAFSSGGLPESYDATFTGLDAKANDQLRLLWIACGTEDRLIDANRKFHGWLDSKGIRHTYVETPGAHTWLVWRRNLATLAPMLFQQRGS